MYLTDRPRHDIFTRMTKSPTVSSPSNATPNKIKKGRGRSKSPMESAVASMRNALIRAHKKREKLVRKIAVLIATTGDAKRNMEKFDTVTKSLETQLASLEAISSPTATV